jgi:5-methyltetrahydrofolate--homocysteine methyltransferase
MPRAAANSSDLLLAEDYDAILELGREQVEGGAHALDISVAVTERRMKPS